MKIQCNNIDAVLPAAQSELVKGIIKDPLLLDFIGISEFAKKSELQRSLIANLKHFMLEPGKGFALVDILLERVEFAWS